MESSRKVTVVDDEPLIRELIGERLKREGYCVAQASNGLEALRMAVEGNCHAVVTDLNMPVLDGVGLYRSIRKIHPPLGRRFIFMSANPDREANEVSIRDKVPMLEKPVMLTELVSCLKEL